MTELPKQLVNLGLQKPSSLPQHCGDFCLLPTPAAVPSPPQHSPYKS